MSDQPVIFQKTCSSLHDTASLAGALSQLLAPGDVVTLSGTLGAGKTAFIRAALQQVLGPSLEVPSPTFNLLLTYEAPEGQVTYYHYDLYRLESPDEVLELDIDEAFDEGISFIEWADRMGRYLPDDTLDIHISILEQSDAEQRVLSFRGHQDWAKRLLPLQVDRNA